MSSSYFHSPAPDTCGEGESRHSIRPVSLCTRRAPAADSGGGAGREAGRVVGGGGTGDLGGEATGAGGGEGEGERRGAGEGEGEGVGAGAG